MSSTPSTPARSARASSTASSPAMQTSKPPIELTPRSKVKAMLAEAGMSDDSEDELSTKPSNEPSKPAEPVAKPAPAASKPALNDASSDSEEDDIVPVKRPAGRMAARMLAQNQNAQSEGGDEEDGNAYQRVRKMLMSAKDRQKESSGRSSPTADAESSSGEDMPFSRPAPARRLARKSSKSPKPAAPASRASSPGLFVSPSKPSPAKSTASLDNGSNSDSDMSDFKPKSRLEELVAQKKAERKAKEAAEKKTREENRRKAKAAARKSDEIDRELNGSETDSNDEEGVAEKLTQQARPTRRAGKKAQEEMNRETQRIARNMQLAHQAKTKKKYTTQDLFKKFNFGQPKESTENAAELASSDVDQPEKETPPTSQPSMDEAEKPTAQEQGMDSNGLPEDTVVDIGQRDGTDIGLTVLRKAHRQPKIDKGKGRAVSPRRESSVQVALEPAAKPAAPVPAPDKKARTFRVVLPERPVTNTSDSDDDLEIVRDTRFAVFDSLPERQAKEPKHLLRLRHLAHLTSPSKSRHTDRNSMGPDQLQAVLQRRAREQAKAEKEEKIAELRAKGIMVQTEEERERDQLELENLLEKARKEADELAKKEKSEAKKNGEDDGDGLLDSEDDESYVEGGSDAEEVEDEELELSGSEDEEDEGADGEGLLDDEAGEDEDDEMADEEDVPEKPDVEVAGDDAESEEEATPARRRAVVARNRNRVFDDEDEESEAKSTEQQPQPEPSQDETMAAFGFANNAAPVGLTQMFAGTMADMNSQPNNQQSQPEQSQDETMAAFGFANNAAPVGLTQMFNGTMADVDSEPTERQAQPEATQDETMAAFGFANNAAPVGLSQMFAGTMADMNSQAEIPEGAVTQQDSLDFLRNIPISTLPEFETTFLGPSQDSLVRDSQLGESQAESGSNDINIGISQFPSQPQDFPDTQMSDIPEPTQDGGFAVSRTPGRFNRTPQASSTQKTVDTVILEDGTPESPIVQRKKGRLQRRREIVATSISDVEEDAQPRPDNAVSEAAASDEEFAISADAFNVMRKGAKKAKKIEAFNKKKSAAKEMVQEQAEESEDEYAGLGGASDDESGGEMDEELKDMIDESKVKLNERDIAAFYADKERAEDEKRIDKLYKDITNGNLRRKRGGDFGSLDDSDDEAAERRAKKQREFARMRKALLADENIGKIAENPKKLAFLRAIEDHDDDEDFDFFEYKDSTGPEESQSQSIPDSQEAPQQRETSTTDHDAVAQANPLKRKAPPTTESNDENRPPARQRRTAPASDRKPTTLAEIRESVSFLIDEPLVRETQFSASEDEDDEEEEGDDEQQQQQLNKVATTTTTTTRASFNERRTVAPVVDRLTLSRSASAASTTSTTTTEQPAAAAATTGKPLAFAAPATTTGLHGFKVPSLLRRATTNLSTTSTTSNSSTASNNAAAGAASAADQAGLRRGGSKKSNIHYQAREAERKKAVVAVEARREEGLRKKVVKGRGRSVLGVLGGGGGGFE